MWRRNSIFPDLNVILKHNREMKRSSREQAAVEALIALIEGQDRERLAFDHHPDEVLPPARNQRKAPDYQFTGRSGCILVEHTQLSTATPQQLRWARTHRIYDALHSVTWPIGVYVVDVLTHDDRKVKNLIGSEEFTVLLQAASLLDPISAFGSDFAAKVVAFHRRDPRYFAADAGEILLLSKQSAVGSGISIMGPHESAPADGTITLSDEQGNTVEVPTTSRSLFEPTALESSLADLFVETEEKSGYRPDCRGILLLDVGTCPAGPLLIESAVIKGGLERWPRIREVVLFVDEPYSDPPPPSGLVSGNFRFWRIGTAS